jgi:ABC-type transporter Mla MlaB component
MHPSTSRGSGQMPAAGLTFSCDRFRTGVARLALTGELDRVTASSAAQDESSVLICDLSGLWLVDLTGLRVLMDATAHARHTGRRLVVANAPSIVPRMLRLLKLEHALEVPAVPLRTPPAHACASFRPHVSGEVSATRR